jgi:hypothetical protein
VELALIDYGRVCWSLLIGNHYLLIVLQKASKSKELYRKFLTLVRRSCDRVHSSNHTDLSFRDTLYTRDLDNIYGTLREMENLSLPEPKNKPERMTNKHLPPIKTSVTAQILTSPHTSNSLPSGSSSDASASTQSDQKTPAIGSAA